MYTTMDIGESNVTAIIREFSWLDHQLRSKTMCGKRRLKMGGLMQGKRPL